MPTKFQGFTLNAFLKTESFCTHFNCMQISIHRNPYLMEYFASSICIAKCTFKTKNTHKTIFCAHLPFICVLYNKVRNST